MNSPVQFSTLRTEIGGVPVIGLARQFGTPAYVYDAAKILERINDLRAFDSIRFAQKACSNLAILDLARRNGVLVDAVSAGEIRRALAAGYSPHGDPPPIVYTADVFDRETLDLIAQLRLHVNCGSPDMIDQLGERLSGESGFKITLRLNPGFGHGHSRKTNTGGEQSKHGIWHEQLGDCLLRAKRHGLRVTELHMHIGSGTDLEHLRQVCGAMERAALEVGAGIEAFPSPIETVTRTSIWPSIFRCGMARVAGSPSRADTLSDWKLSPGGIWSPRADFSSPKSAPSSRPATTPFIWSMQASTT
jgi:diaminopimelate decarboxylase